MKKRITEVDLEQLTDTQKQSLNNMWIPEIYDPAVAYMCVDVTEDLYRKIEFVTGGIEINKYGNITLYDIRYLPNTTGVSDSDAENTEEYNDDTEDDSDVCDNDFEFISEQPVSFNKGDCLPLLNIGQMIEILERYNFGKYDFYLTASTYEIGCDIGRNDGNFNTDYEKAELCDVLWESVKALME